MPSLYEVINWLLVVFIVITGAFALRDDAIRHDRTVIPTPTISILEVGASIG